ncbi:MAG: histidine--tRNA ligase [Terriglobia bacterium]
MPDRIHLIRGVKGTRDLLPPGTALWQRVEDDARQTFEAYDFKEIRTPIIEPTALFARSVGADTDIVSKEMYTFEDRDHESLTLRPEATASVVRSCLEHGLLNDSGIHKLYYIGPMFRRERPQKGRYRQFYQIGAEVLGSDHPLIDVEAIEMLESFLDSVAKTGAGEFRLLINSVGCGRCRPAYLKLLRHELERVKAEMCGDCQRRAETNPLRVFDCKVEADQPIIAGLPTILDHLCMECRQHFETVTEELRRRGIRHHITPRLVRGLDYYTRTTFEITSDALGAQNALLGGGRYDGLAELLGGPPTPAFGFAIGEDRLVETLSAVARSAGNPEWGEALLHVFIAWMDHQAGIPANDLARELRAQRLKVALMYEPMKLKKALSLGSRLGARFAVIIGEQELASGRYQVKNMKTGEQEEVERESVAGYLHEKIGA